MLLFLIFAYTILTLLFIFTVLTVIYTAYAMLTAAPFVPMSMEHVRQVVALAQPKPTDTLIDLGSGDGRIVFAAAKSGAKCIGIEINPLLFWWSRIWSFFNHNSNVEFRRTNLWDVDTSTASIITIFFLASRMDKLMKKLQSELKPGSRVISYGFKFPNWEITGRDGRVYLYTIK